MVQCQLSMLRDKPRCSGENDTNGEDLPLTVQDLQREKVEDASRLIILN